MARAENQGLQIALIVFVMLTILLAVVTFLYVRNYQEAMAQNVQLTKSAADNKKTADSAQVEINKVKELLGLDVNMTIDKVQATFDEDMKQYAVALPGDKQHYRDALESLWNTNQEIFSQSTKVQGENRKLQDQLARREEERDRQIKEYREKSETEASERVAEHNKFEEDRRGIVTEQQSMVDKITQKDNERAEVAARAAEQQKAADAELKKYASNNVELADRNKRLQDRRFEVADGKIVYRANENVYVNLGSADSLAPLTTFSVHDKLANTSQGEG